MPSPGRQRKRLGVVNERRDAGQPSATGAIKPKRDRRDTTVPKYRLLIEQPISPNKLSTNPFVLRLRKKITFGCSANLPSDLGPSSDV
jgi:hypothetical protein